MTSTETPQAPSATPSPTRKEPRRAGRRRPVAALCAGVVLLAVILAGCSTPNADSGDLPPAGEQGTPSTTPTPQPENIADVSATFTVTTGNGYTADATMTYSIAPFTKSIVDAAPGHTNLSAVITSAATATNTTKGRQNPETFRADGWIAYDSDSVACTSQIAQVFTHLHTKNGRYCLFNTASFFFGPFDPDASVSVDSSQAPDPVFIFPGVLDTDVPGVIAAASKPAATMIEVLTASQSTPESEASQTVTTHSADSICQIVADRDVLMPNGGWEPDTISAVVVNGVGCSALTAP